MVKKIDEARLEVVKKQLESAGVGELFGTKKEVKHLPDFLEDDEVVKYAVNGFIDKATVLIVVTDRRLMFINQNIIFGVDYKEIPYKAINDIAYSTRAFPSVSVTNGANTTRIRLISRKTAPTFVQKLNSAIKSVQDGEKDTQPSSDLDQLTKLKELTDAGVISVEEFEAKKKQILGI